MGLPKLNGATPLVLWRRCARAGTAVGIWFGANYFSLQALIATCAPDLETPDRKGLASAATGPLSGLHPGDWPIRAERG